MLSDHRTDRLRDEVDAQARFRPKWYAYLEDYARVEVAWTDLPEVLHR